MLVVRTFSLVWEGVIVGVDSSVIGWGVPCVLSGGWGVGGAATHARPNPLSPLRPRNTISV